MHEDELAPVSVEVLNPDEIESLDSLMKVEKPKSGIGVPVQVDALLDVAKDAATLLHENVLYKVSVPDGYSLSDLVKSSKGDGSLRALVKDSNNHFNGDVSLIKNSLGAAQVVSIGLTAAAAVVGQAYMTEISDSLERIDSKLDSVIAMIESDKRATVKNAIEMAGTYLKQDDDIVRKPVSAQQAVRNEIEARYNDVASVAEWVVDQVDELKKRADSTKPTEKNLTALLRDFHSYEQQFSLCLRGLSALAMTRMYFDGCFDERSVLAEREMIALKSKKFADAQLNFNCVLQVRIASMKTAPLALPRFAEQGGGDKRLLLEGPRAVAKEKSLEKKRGIRSFLDAIVLSSDDTAKECDEGIGRIAQASQRAHTILTDGDECWFVEEEKK